MFHILEWWQFNLALQIELDRQNDFKELCIDKAEILDCLKRANKSIDEIKRIKSSCPLLRQQSNKRIRQLKSLSRKFRGQLRQVQQMLSNYDRYGEINP